MKRELRRHIKQDEFATGLSRALTWARDHEREVKLAAGALIVALVGGVGLQTWRQGREHRAEQAFATALATFSAPVAAELPEGAERPAGTVHANAEERYRKALAQFDEVAKDFGSLPAGIRARYYAALCRAELGQWAEAEKALNEIAAGGRGDDLIPSLARLALAEVHRRSGRMDQALEDYRRIIDDSKAAVPRDHALMRLASALEEADKLGEASASYRRLVEEFPGSVYAAEARRRADYLDAAERG